MINKRIAISGLSILTALSLMTGATFAYFSDSGISTGNTFSSGTLDLQLSNSGESFTDNVTATFGGTNMAPGGSEVLGTLHLKNNGTIDANHEDIAFSNSLTQALSLPGSDSTHPMDQFLQVTTLTFDGTDYLNVGTTGHLTDHNSNGFLDMDDLETQGLSNLAGIAAGGTKNLVLGVALHTSTPNDIQGDSVTTTVNVTLTQAP